MTDIQNIEVPHDANTMKICFVSTPKELYFRGFFLAMGFFSALSVLYVLFKAIYWFVK